MLKGSLGIILGDTIRLYIEGKLTKKWVKNKTKHISNKQNNMEKKTKKKKPME